MARERITPDSASPPIAFISRDDVEHATRVVREELHRTPILALGWLAELGVEGVVHAKLETRQIMGSFKTRGALSRMSCDDVARHHGVEHRRSSCG